VDLGVTDNVVSVVLTEWAAAGRTIPVLTDAHQQMRTSPGISGRLPESVLFFNGILVHEYLYD